MSHRRGYYIEDQFATYFLSTTVVSWIDVFVRKECKDIIIDAFKYCIENKGLDIHAYVIMSSHIHCIMTARQGSIGLSAILRDFKKHTSKELLTWILHSNQESRKDWMKALFTKHAANNKNNKSYQLCNKITSLNNAFTQSSLPRK